ncbi:MAG: helix-turn-helix domain-containing protein [Alphaproteobacteria bacterium]|nr:helix-turn-helix domain-containing protein [Alphaproteobacteria bacterium]MBU0796860.1 helix-turn-helix domain-containing protein [Alphaproteobacteria bacterium]MBU0885782.1 helix-turn-helix domain-containing protein [Alphaproteobacteria bacterium]MBU1812141.1 helix-turn-helix domain-containing protein [Alphaproteobacteria bacterium]MBU2091887.1 helix-turn-helix domain-containing protein [Alphaproteobacteria bacterium]
MTPFVQTQCTHTAAALATADVEDPCSHCESRAVSMCASLDEAGLAALSHITTAVPYAAKTDFVSEGEPATYLFNVTSGTVKLYRLLADGRRQIVGFLSAGDFIGIAVDDCYLYSAETVTPVTVCRFPRVRFKALLENYPALEKRLFLMARHELVAAQDQILLLGRKTAKERIASFLMTVKRHGTGTGDPVLVLPMSRSDIADYLGLTIETVSRTFTQFRQEGLIRLDGVSNVVLLQPDALAELAEGL